MGDGHNTAARSIADALMSERPGGVEVLVADPYTRTNPMINRLVQSGYTLAINRYPRAWKIVFQLLSRRGVVEGMSPLLSELRQGVKDIIEEFQPDLIASTYPVFSYILAKLRKSHPQIRQPFYTVVTDSTLINSTWYRWRSDGLIVSDALTAEAICEGGVPSAEIHTLGFPVSLSFEKLSPIPAPTGKQPWKILFVPGGTSGRAKETIQSLVRMKNLTVQVVTGRRKKMFSSLVAAHFPSNVSISGWTDQMPAIMASHHLFIGKAGGATVQEAIAAQLPFLVSHIVPGQEEGNIELIQRTGIGALASSSAEVVGGLVEGALANDAQLWRAWRKNLEAIQKPSAARSIAHFLLEKIPPAV